MIISRFLIRNFGGRKADIVEVLGGEEKPVSQGFCIWQNCPLKVREKLRDSPMNKNEGVHPHETCRARNAQGSAAQ